MARESSHDSSRIGRRRFLKLTGTGTAATLAGCTGGGDGDGSGGDGDGGGDGGSTPTSTPTGTATPEQSIEGPIRVGTLAPANNPVAQDITRAAELAATQINENGGIAGVDVEIVPKDTGGEPSTARSVYQELTIDEGVDFTAGVFSSEALLAILPNIARQQTVHLNTAATTPVATQKVNSSYEKLKYFFRVGPVNSYFQGVNMVDFAGAKFDDMGWDSIALLAGDFKWTQVIGQYIQDNLESETGTELATYKRISPSVEDFTSIYDEVESMGVDGVYVLFAHHGANSVIQWVKQQRPFGYAGINVVAASKGFYKQTDGAPNRTVVRNSATENAELTEKTVPFAEAFAAEYDDTPSTFGYTTVDAVYMMKEAVEAAGSTNPDDLVGALEEMSYTGTRGTVEFYGRDEEYTHDAKYGLEYLSGVFSQWQSGTKAPLWPDDVATTQYKAPGWVK